MEHQSRVRNARRRCRKSILPPCWGSRSTPENDQIWERYNQRRTRCSRLLSKLPSNCRLLPWLLLLLTSYVVNSCNSKVIKCSSLSVVPRYNRLFYNILLPWELNYHLLYYSKSEVQHLYACLCTPYMDKKRVRSEANREQRTRNCPCSYSLSYLGHQECFMSSTCMSYFLTHDFNVSALGANVAGQIEAVQLNQPLSVCKLGTASSASPQCMR